MRGAIGAGLVVAFVVAACGGRDEGAAGVASVAQAQWQAHCSADRACTGQSDCGDGMVCVADGSSPVNCCMPVNALARDCYRVCHPCPVGAACKDDCLQMYVCPPEHGPPIEPPAPH